MRNSDAEKRVDFLIVGAQKAGTTALFDHLTEIPALELPAVKEAHFFDDEDHVDWAAPDYASYHAMFTDPARIWGEATPIYAYWPHAMERIHAYNPAIKLIFLFRDPIERAWSHWKMEYARGKENAPFGWCIREGRSRMAAAAPYPGYHRVYSYVERGFYGRQIARLLDLFPRRQLLILAAEELKNDPTGVIGKTCDFLGVVPPGGPIAKKRSRLAAEIDYSTTLSEMDVIFLQRHYADEMERFRLLSGC